MSTFTRTISRTVTNAAPTWRSAMANTDTLYHVTANTPEGAPLLGTLPSFMGTGTESYVGAAYQLLAGFSSGTHLTSEGGAFGTMVYGTGGHSNIMTQMLGVDLSDDAPTWTYWQNPYYETTDTFATTGSEIYYNSTEAAALIAGPRGTAARIRNGSEAADAATWDDDFPVTFEGWMFPRKMTTGQMGNNAPHGFRYSSQCFIPASVTGGDPVLFVVPAVQGPFSQGYSPSTVTDVQWMDAAVLSGGNRRWPYHFKNLTTGAWTLHQWSPVGIRTGFGGTMIGCFTDIKRVYVCSYINSSPGFYYIDFTSGFPGSAPSTPVTGLADIQLYAHGAFSEGDAQGRHFAVFGRRGTGYEGHISVFDFDAGNSFTVDLSASGLNIPMESEKACFTYDRDNQRILAIAQNFTTQLVEYWSITPPSTMGASGWTCSSTRSLSFDGTVTSSNYTDASAQEGLSYFYGKSQYIPALGVCMIVSNRQRMLGFRPSA